MRRLNRAARQHLLGTVRFRRFVAAYERALNLSLGGRLVRAGNPTRELGPPWPVPGLPPTRQWFRLVESFQRAPAPPPRWFRCAHPVIREDVRHPDGSVDGKCLDCGARGFPIRDVAWEEFRAALARGDAP